MKKINLKDLYEDKGCLSEYDPNSLSYDKAILYLEQLIQPIKKTKKISIEDAEGNILATDVKSSINVPNYNNSAMDGYVFRHESLKKNNNKVKLLGKILAGHPVDSNQISNVCFKIMTGGMIPKGFDTVIPQELVKIDDVFSISGRGTVVTGRVERGVIKVGEEIEIVGIKETAKTTCTGVEMFRKLLDSGEAGDNVGVLLRGTKREEVERGQVLSAPGSIKPYSKFKGEAYILTKDEGGRHTPFFSNYRPQFYFRTTDVTGAVELPSGTEMVMPGDNIAISVELITPIAMDEGLRFAIREGGRTVGAGVVSSIES